MTPEQSTRLADHRKLGRQLRFFATEDLVGAGLPLWLPNGTIVRHCLENFILELEREHGYLHVVTPQLAKRRLYEISGHWQHFQEDMFPPMQVGGEELVLRPMNCPHHLLVFASETRSYRDLPVRIAELGTMYRQERSGVLGGLRRVRAMTLNDAHIFCTPPQIRPEITNILELMKTCYAALGISDYTLRLSLRSEAAAKYVADDEIWSQSEGILRDVLETVGAPHVEASGEAAFYGPKIDIQVHDYLGREFTLSTIQLDFHLPTRFKLAYVDEHGERMVPIAIHRSIISTMERMVAHLLEIHQGALPPWLSPVQVAVLPVHEDQHNYAAEVETAARSRGIRCEVRFATDTLGSRIRSAHAAKIPYVAVVGSKERDGGTVTLRLRDGTSLPTQKTGELLALVSSVISSRLTTLTP